MVWFWEEAVREELETEEEKEIAKQKEEAAQLEQARNELSNLRSGVMETLEKLAGMLKGRAVADPTLSVDADKNHVKLTVLNESLEVEFDFNTPCCYYRRNDKQLGVVRTENTGGWETENGYNWAEFLNWMIIDFARAVKRPK